MRNTHLQTQTQADLTMSLLDFKRGFITAHKHEVSISITTEQPKETADSCQ